MEPPPSRSSHWKLISALGITAICLGLASFFLPKNTRLESSPTLVRPWAEEHFLKLTKPVPSSGKPTDPQYTARCTVPVFGADRPTNFGLKFQLAPATTEFVPKFEIIEFDAAEGFTRGEGSGKIEWFAAKPFHSPPDDEREYFGTLDMFHPDGRPMTRDEATAKGITKNDRTSWGGQYDGKTSLEAQLTVSGYQNTQWELQDVFDAATRMSILHGSQSPRSAGFRLSTSLSALHDAPLLVVIDFAHGPTVDLSCPPVKGAIVTHPDFQLEVIEVVKGNIHQGGWEREKSGRTMRLNYEGPVASESKSFSVLYQITPAVMAKAISVEALDAAGGEIKTQGRFMKDVPVSRFEQPLADAASLRVRYRPHLTRLLMRMKSMPSAPASNLQPLNLFDVQAPGLTLRSPFEMQNFIAATTQLKDVTGNHAHSPTAGFPMTLSRASLRDVVVRYLALGSERRVKVDPVAMTIEFEKLKKPTWIDKSWLWLKSMPWRP
jgi:hypothetical protein